MYTPAMHGVSLYVIFQSIYCHLIAFGTRFHGIIQMGFHRVLADLESSSKEADEEQQDVEELDALDLDVLTADTVPAPATPRAFTRTLSRAVSARQALHIVSPNTTPFAPNQFTKVPPSFSSSAKQNSPTMEQRKLRSVKRERDERPGSPPRKRNKMST